MKTPQFLIEQGMKGLIANIADYEKMKKYQEDENPDIEKTLHELYQDRDDCLRAIKILNEATVKRREERT